MGLLASLYAALFGTRSSHGEQEQPSELTAVSPDFTGFVSNRPREPDAAANVAPLSGDSDLIPVAGRPKSAGGAPPTPTGAGPAPGANEFSAVAPEFAGRVSNRPPPGKTGGAPQGGSRRL